MHSLYYSYTIANVSPLLLDLDSDLLIRESDSANLKSSPRSGPHTGAVLALKPEATAIFASQDGRWKITVSFDGRRFCVPKFRH